MESTRSKYELPSTEREETQLKRLPARECANFGTGLCPRDCLVVEGKRCRYFEEAVLPLKPELREAYRRRNGRKSAA